MSNILRAKKDIPAEDNAVILEGEIVHGVDTRTRQDGETLICEVKFSNVAGDMFVWLDLIAYVDCIGCYEE